MMVSNVYALLPKNWVIQIFYDPSKETALEGIQYQAIQRLVYKGIVHVTALPFPGMKKRDIMVSRWLWENMLADRVFFFGGSGILCGNSPYGIDSFNKFQFISDSENLFSSRNRTLMLEAIDDHNKTSLEKRKNLKDDEMIAKFISTNMEKLGSPLLPTPLDVAILSNGQSAGDRPLGVVGTLSALSTSQKMEYMDYCPEIKVFFPSLLADACFGASPEPILCMQYLCQEGGLTHQCRGTNKTVNFIAETKKGLKTRLALSLQPAADQTNLEQS